MLSPQTASVSNGSYYAKYCNSKSLQLKEKLFAMPTIDLSNGMIKTQMLTIYLSV